MKVKLYVYDLSQGMAKAMSMAFVGRQVDGIWHTSVVAYGKEYFFGQGIGESLPGRSPYGEPVQIVEMGISASIFDNVDSIGETEIPLHTFLEYLDEMRQIFTPEKYHLLDNNCNDFSNEVCQFLVGRHIPSHITGLPQEFMNTPLGQTLRPMIDSMFSSRIHPPHSSVGLSGPSSILKHVSSDVELDNLIGNSKAVTVMFSHLSQPQSKSIISSYENYVKSFGMPGKGSWDAGVHVLLALIVDLDKFPNFVQKYGVSTDPTFFSFLEGSNLEKLVHPQPKLLEEMVRDVMFQAYPVHPHLIFTLKSSTDTNIPLKHDAINIDLVVSKAKETFSNQKVPEVLSLMENCLRTGSCATSLVTKMTEIFEHLPRASALPFLDILRILVLNSTIKEQLIKSKMLLIMKILEQYALGSTAEKNGISMNIVIVSIRLLENILSNTDYAMCLFENRSGDTILISDMQIVISTILSHILESSSEYSGKYNTECKLQLDLASCCFNVSLVISKIRQMMRGLEPRVDKWVMWETESNEPDFIVELVSALLHHLSSCDIAAIEDQILTRYLAALFHLFYLCSDETLPQIAEVMNFTSVLDRYKGENGRILDLIADLRKLSKSS